MSNDDSLFTPAQKQFLGEAAVNFGKLVMVFTRLVALPAETLLRRNFGERYVGGLLAILSWMLLAIWSDVADHGRLRLVPKAPQARSAQWGAPARQAEKEEIAIGGGGGIRNLAVLSFFFTICHWIVIDRRNRKKIRCHSRYPGDPWPIWPVRRFGYATVVQVIEPMFCVVLGLALVSFSAGGKSGVGGYLVAAGLSLLLHASVARMIERRKRLDAIDQQIEAKVMAESIAEWKEPGIESTTGFVVPEHMKTSTPAERLDYVRATQALDPKLRALVASASSGGRDDRVGGRLGYAHTLRRPHDPLAAHDSEPTESHATSRRRTSASWIGRPSERASAQTWATERSHGSLERAAFFSAAEPSFEGSPSLVIA